MTDVVVLVWKESQQLEWGHFSKAVPPSGSPPQGTGDREDCDEIFSGDQQTCMVGPPVCVEQDTVTTSLLYFYVFSGQFSGYNGHSEIVFSHLCEM